MIRYSPSAREPVPAELPTARAKLEIQAGPLTPCGSTPGRMRPNQLSQLIVTLGVLGCVVTGTAGAILIVRIAPRQAGLPLAGFVLALAAALVIAVSGMARDRGRRSQPQPASGRRAPRRPLPGQREGGAREQLNRPASEDCAPRRERDGNPRQMVHVNAAGALASP